MTRFGFNGNAAAMGDKEAFYRWHIDAGSTSALVMDGKGEALELYRRMKQAGVDKPIVVARFYSNHEGDDYDRISPSSYVSQLARAVGNDKHLFYYILNEPGIGGNQVKYNKLLKWLQEVGDLASASGIKTVIGNFATASTIQKEWLETPETITFVRWASSYTNAGKGYIGFHDYAGPLVPVAAGHNDPNDLARLGAHWPSADEMRNDTGNNWLIMRWMWLEELAVKLGLAPFLVLITECFIDRMPNLEAHGIIGRLDAQYGKLDGPFTLGRYYQSILGMTIGQALRLQAEWMERVYPPYVHGFHMFAWNYNPQWHNRGFNFANQPDALRELTKIKGELMPEIKKGTPVDATLSTGYNLRATPSTSGVVVTSVARNATVKYYPDSATLSGSFTWVGVEYGAFSGWMASQGQFVPIPVFGTPVVHLPVKALSQLGTGINNCAPACVAMLYNYWLDATESEAARITVQRADEVTPENPTTHFASVGDIETGLKALDFESTYVTNFRLEDIRKDLDSGIPVIVLVERGRIPNTQATYAYTGAHFVIVVGYGDGYVILHDPLGIDNLYVVESDFSAAWYSTTGNAGHNQAVISNEDFIIPPVVNLKQYLAIAVISANQIPQVSAALKDIVNGLFFVKEEIS